MVGGGTTSAWTYHAGEVASSPPHTSETVPAPKADATMQDATDAKQGGPRFYRRVQHYLSRQPRGPSGLADKKADEDLRLPCPRQTRPESAL